MNLNKIILTSLCAIITATAAFAAGENVVASKKYTDDTFQTKISTGNVLFRDFYGDGVYYADDGDLQVPGLVAYDPTTGALSGTKIGILDQETMENGWTSLSDYSDLGGYGAKMDNFVPTVRAVANELTSLYMSKQDTIPRSGYNSAVSGATAYNTNAASNGHSWLSPSVKGTGLVTRTANNGKIGERKIFESTDVANYHAAALSQNEKDIQDISIPTVGAMMTAIQNGSAALIPAGTAGNVVTYTGTAGVVGSNTVASAATYNQQTGALENGTAIANIAAVDTRQKKKVCAGWPDSVAVADRTDANCWLWSLPD